ncbi:hypothetical protein DERP_009092 [Dermatophagoides pteronyssinus]|uniref:Uncharacterized protein n=1 Tax=Dermatophagoides pteronyssinus TaxID=6956 RepID=A0ABQ8JR83_DERPT|nr:hypothetical protein DERP_009092 [Dermatophagoides pteronyssinus]
MNVNRIANKIRITVPVVCSQINPYAPLTHANTNKITANVHEKRKCSRQTPIKPIANEINEKTTQTISSLPLMMFTLLFIILLSSSDHQM